MMRRCLLFTALLLTACAAGPAAHDGMQEVHVSLPPSREDLVIGEEAASPGTFAFTIRRGDAIVTDFTVQHTKDMHFIVVRRDLEHFQHLHPVRDAEGFWRVPLSVPAGGTYWLYADFADAQGTPHTVRLEKRMPGEGADGAVQPHLGDLAKDPDGYDAAEKQVDGYRIQVSTHRTIDGTAFVYTVFDATGNVAPLEGYLGARGHSILISTKGDFVHTHPFDERGLGSKDRPAFFTSYPRDDFYRIFTQLKTGGKVLVTDFDWDHPAPPPSAEPGEEEEEAARRPATGARNPADDGTMKEKSG